MKKKITLARREPGLDEVLSSGVYYVYAYDPKIKRRVVHVIGKDKKGQLWAISLVTGNQFKYKPNKKKKK